LNAPYRAADPLGNLVSAHPVAAVQQGVRIGVGLFCLLVALDCFAVPFFDVPGTRALDWPALIALGAVGLAFGALAIWSFSHFVRARHACVSVHEHGLRLQAGARDPRDVRWGDIVSVGGLFWESPSGAPPQASVLWIDERAGGRIALPSPVREPFALGREILRHTFEARLEAARARLAEPAHVRFGRLLLGPDALVLDVDSIPRNTIERVALTSRFLELRIAARIRRLVPTEQVPDADVLLSLLSPAASP
jgi:hypothetical protein